MRWLLEQGELDADKSEDGETLEGTVEESMGRLWRVSRTYGRSLCNG